MKKTIPFILSFAVLGIVSFAFAFGNSPKQAFADGEEPTSISSDSQTSEEPLSSDESSESSSSEESAVSYYASITYKVGYTGSNGGFEEDASRGYPVVVPQSEGNVGDVVKFSFKGSISLSVKDKWFITYSLSSVYVNDTQITGDLNGDYSFDIKEGTDKYDIMAYFDNESTSTWSEIFGFDWTSLLTTDNLIKLILIIASFFGLGTVTWLIAKMKKTKTVTLNDVMTAIPSLIEEATKANQNKLIESQIKPVLDIYNQNAQKTSDILKTLVKITILQQEGSASSKIAIVEELEKLNFGDGNLSDKVKEAVSKEFEEQKQKINQQKEALANAQKSTDAIGTNDGEQTSSDSQTVHPVE